MRKSKAALPSRTDERPAPDRSTWIVTLLGDDPDRQRVHDSVLTIADGRFGGLAE